MRILGGAKLRAWWEMLRTSYWFVPTLMAGSTMFFWMVVQRVDLWLKEEQVRSLGWIYTGGPEGARELLGVVAGSMITVTGVTFSITIVALALASQQFGPFLLRNFMRDTGNQIVLGTFISTFVFCLLTLRVVRGLEEISYVPHLSVTVAIILALCSIGVLIYFIHHVSVSIQVSNIIYVVSQDLQRSIERLFPEPIATGAEPEAEPSGSPRKLHEGFDSQAKPVVSTGYGYITALDDQLLLSEAMERDVVVQLLKRPGDFVGKGDTVALVWPGGSVDGEVERAVNDSLLLGSQRTATQDVLFVCDQLVEIAVRALSPGINDPFTANVCIDHLGQGLSRMAGRALPSPYRVAEDGVMRLVAYPVDFCDMAETVLVQIRHYGSSNPAVLLRLLQAVVTAAPHLRREEDRETLLRHARLIMQAGERNLPGKDELESVRDGYERAVKALKLVQVGR